MVVYYSVRDGEVHFVRAGEDVWVPLVDDATVVVSESVPEWVPRIAEHNGYDVETENIPSASKPKPVDA